MSVESDFRSTMLAHPPLVALVGDRIAQHAVPQGEALPLIVYTVIRTPVRGISGSELGEEVTIRAQCWAKTAAAARQVADAVRAACEADGRCYVDQEISVAENDLQLDGIELQIDYWS